MKCQRNPPIPSNVRWVSLRSTHPTGLSPWTRSRGSNSSSWMLPLGIFTYVATEKPQILHLGLPKLSCPISSRVCSRPTGLPPLRRLQPPVRGSRTSYNQSSLMNFVVVSYHLRMLLSSMPGVANQVGLRVSVQLAQQDASFKSRFFLRTFRSQRSSQVDFLDVWWHNQTQPSGFREGKQ